MKDSVVIKWLFWLYLRILLARFWIRACKYIMHLYKYSYYAIGHSLHDVQKKVERETEREQKNNDEGKSNLYLYKLPPLSTHLQLSL